MSRCFGTINRVTSTESHEEHLRKYAENWDSTFTDPNDYAEFKIKMLKHDMRIDISDADISHLRELKTRGAIDAAARAIINKYWR